VNPERKLKLSVRRAAQCRQQRVMALRRPRRFVGLDAANAPDFDGSRAGSNLRV